MDVNLSDLLNKVPGAPSGGVNIPGLGSGTPLINTAGESADANGICTSEFSSISSSKLSCVLLQ